MNKVIIADASPLIAFGGIDKLSVLHKLFGQVVIPEVVAAECLADMAHPGAIAIEKAINDKLIQVYSTAIDLLDDAVAVLDQV